MTQDDIHLQFDSHIVCGLKNPYLDDLVQLRLVWEALEGQ